MLTLSPGSIICYVGMPPRVIAKSSAKPAKTKVHFKDKVGNFYIDVGKVIYSRVEKVRHEYSLY